MTSQSPTIAELDPDLLNILPASKEENWVQGGRKTFGHSCFSNRKEVVHTAALPHWYWSLFLWGQGTKESILWRVWDLVLSLPTHTCTRMLSYRANTGTTRGLGCVPFPMRVPLA